MKEIKQVMPTTKKENEIWRTGYDMGVKAMMQENDIALKIGNTNNQEHLYIFQLLREIDKHMNNLGL